MRRWALKRKGIRLYRIFHRDWVFLIILEEDTETIFLCCCLDFFYWYEPFPWLRVFLRSNWLYFISWFTFSLQLQLFCFQVNSLWHQFLMALHSWGSDNTSQGWCQSCFKNCWLSHILGTADLKFKPWTQSSCFCCFLSKSMISSFDHREKKKDSINNSPETLDILKIVLNATDASSLQTVFRRMIEHILLEFLVFNAFNAIAFLSQTFLGKTWVGKRTTTFRSRTALTEQQKTDTQNKEEWKWDHVWNWIRLTKDDLWAERIPYKRLLLCKGIS